MSMSLNGAGASLVIWLGAAIMGAGASLAATPVAAGPLQGTEILDIGQGSARTAAVRRASRGGYELADGTGIEFADWYAARFPDVRAEFLTPIGDDLGLIWGFSTGEQGEKYRISPGLVLGFVLAVRPSARSTFSLIAKAQFGSDLHERSCTANYGPIGGVQQVNCRLAASLLPPEDTLRHRFSARGIDDSRIALRYELRF